MAENKFKQELYSDEGDYQKSELTIKEIILRHLRKISDICCQEFTGGYWDKKPIKTQSGIMFTEVYHQDIREAYCNAVDFLIDIIYPMGDDKLQTYLKSNEDIDKEIEDIKKRLSHKRKTFREINYMFERTNFWQSSESSNE